MTTKLIQELAGLCVEKNLYFTYDPHVGEIKSQTGRFDDIVLRHGNAPAQLQKAIDKIKEL